jgi:uncharacterized protein YbdZ (MbtH family)
MSETTAALSASVWVRTGRWQRGELDQGALEYPYLLQDPAERMNMDQIRAVLGEQEWSRMTGFSYAGLAAIIHAYGAHLTGIEFAEDGGSIQAKGATPETAAGRVALALGGQGAVSIYLDRAYLRDPHRVMASWVLNAGRFAAALSSAQPTAFLCGADARAPQGWSGRAVHLDHIRDCVLGYLEEHWQQVALLAAHLAEHAAADEAVLDAAFAAPAAPMPALGPEHPMFQATAIDPRAIAAAAGYWAGQLRESLAAVDAAGERRGNPPASPEQIERFRAALETEISVLIERRTQQGQGGLEHTVTRRGGGQLVHLVGLSGYNVSPVLETAMTAAGLDPGELYASSIPSVELGEDGAFTDRDGQMAPLWTPGADSPA